MRRLCYALIVGILLVAGCGDDEEEGGGGAATPEATEEAAAGGGGGELTLTADAGGAISWEPGELTAAAGTVTVKLVNESTTPHAVEIEGAGVEEASETITESETEVTAELEAGEYEFYCPVGSHRQSMSGTLTVE